jgi:hypothetical protein
MSELAYSCLRNTGKNEGFFNESINVFNTVSRSKPFLVSLCNQTDPVILKTIAKVLPGNRNQLKVVAHTK